MEAGLFGTLRMGKRRLPAALLAAATIVVGVPLVAATIAESRNQGFVLRAELPRFSRILLPSAIDGPSQPEPQSAEVMQAVAESSQVAPAGENPGLAAATPALAAAPGARQRGAPFIPVEFDILTPGAGNESVSREAITVRKAVRMGGKEVGTLPVKVDGDSRLLVDVGDVRDLLIRSGESANISGNGLISFGELRRAGVDLRYDPGTDAVVLATR